MSPQPDTIPQAPHHRNIQIEGLEENVVPLVRTVSHVTILLEDDTLLSVLREQIVALINFGMTDYTSQGKSRPRNAVELANCKTHMSYYVALSRGTTTDGTIIVQSLNEKVVTSGISGYLRQELRELEILDEITRLRCEGKLPTSVTGLYRRRLIRSFYAWKANHRDPPDFHPAMGWDPSMGPRIPEVTTYSEWRPSTSGSNKRKNTAVDVKPDVLPLSKRSKTESGTVPSGPAANGAWRSLNVGPAFASVVPPVGLIWDNRDHSCAYDATLPVLYNVWVEDPLTWSGRFMELGPLMGTFGLNLRNLVGNGASLENARDD
ncbi:hypothetical protein B0H17DRAFT_961652, partial [Mycena rosella]